MSKDSATVLFVLGTRPEIIKLAPVIRAVESSDILSMQLVHTGQHYDEELSDFFFENLALPSPDERLNVGSGTQAEQTSKGLCGIEQAIRSVRPDIVVALGDTNAVLSAAIATSKMEPLFAHLEAGIRSFDRSMPEEVNRVLADRVTDIAFAPTQTAAQQLKNEGITENVEIVGNTVVDACFEHLSIAEKQSEVLASLNLKRNEYAVATVHRPRNTDNSDRLERILKGLDSQPIPVVFPVHPRTSAALNQIDFRQEGSLNMVEPLDYLDFLKLLTHARAVLTDSGGIQEEASILEIPCLTVRPNTERPETLQAGVNRLIEPEDVERELASLLRDPAARNRMTGHPHLYGDGNAADKVVSKIEAVITTDPE